MEWDFTYTKEDMLAFTAEQYRRNRAPSALLWALAGLVGIFGADLLVQSIRGAAAAHRPHISVLPGSLLGLAWGQIVLLGVLALLAAAAVGALIRLGMPRTLARRVVKKAGRSPRLFGAWHVALGEERLLICRGGLQQAVDPSVIEEAVVCPAGLLVYLYDKKRIIGLPARAFENAGAMLAAANEFRRCAALAKARLLEAQARLLAGQADEQPFPPMPPLPGGEEPLFALPIRLQQKELPAALYAANRRLKPNPYAYPLAAAVCAFALLEGTWAALRGNTAHALLMFGAALVVAPLLLTRAPFFQKQGVRRLVNSEQAVRLTAPGWLVLGAEGFTHTSGALCSYTPYGELNGAAQNEEYLFLLFQGNLLLVAPKRGFDTPARAAQAFAFLQRNTTRRKGK